MDIPSLPIEIWEHIIDYMSGDYHSLTSCSMVCRDWRPRSLFRLPTRITVHTRDDVLRLAMQKGTMWKGPEQVCIHALHHGHDRRIPHFALFSIMLAGRWKRTRQLSIHSADWRAQDMLPNVFLGLATFEFVTHLSLHNVSLPSIVIFRRLACSFPMLQHLSCQKLAFSVEHRVDCLRSSKYTISKELTRLYIGGGASCVGIVNTLTAANACSSLQDVDFQYGDRSSPGDREVLLCIQRILRHAPSLSYVRLTLILGLLQQAEVPAYLRQLDLSKNTRLTTVDLNLLITHPAVDYGWIFRSLANLTAKGLQRFFITFDLEPLQDNQQAIAVLETLGAEILPELDRTLEAHDFMSLLDVAIRVTLRNETKLGKDFSSKALLCRAPIMESRGILRVEVMEIPWIILPW